MVLFFVHFFNGNGRKIAHYIFVLSDRVRKWDRKYGIRKKHLSKCVREGYGAFLVQIFGYRKSL